MILKLDEINLGEYMNQEVMFKALVTNASAAKTKAGADYLAIDLQSKGIKMTRCPKWNTGNLEEAVIGKVYLVKAKVENYKDSVAISILGLDEITTEDVTEYVNKVENIDEHIEYIDKVLDLLGDSDILKVTRHIYEKYRSKFVVYPAAKSMHHDLIGGLAWHTATLIRAAGYMYKLYPYLKLELLVCIALLHDIGKTKEFSMNKIGSVEYSPEGSLVGHIAIMLNEIEIAAMCLNIDSTSNQLLALKNGVASHHGKLEWGSPVVPYTAEARVIHALDKLDAELYQTSRVLKDLDEGEVSVKFNFGETMGVFKY